MKVLIIEDEPLAAERLQRLLHEIDPTIVVPGVISSIKGAIEWFQENPAPDIILLDVELSDGQSFLIFEKIEISSIIIFTTSYDEFALKAFELNSIEYLLKPIKKEELQKSLNKFHRLKAQFAGPFPRPDIEGLADSYSKLQKITLRNQFLVKQGQLYIPIDIKDVAYFYADNRVSFLVTRKNGKYIIDHTIEEIEKMVDPNYFYRANRAFIIQKQSILVVRKTINGKLNLTLVPPQKKNVNVSKERARDFKAWMDQ